MGDIGVTATTENSTTTTENSSSSSSSSSSTTSTSSSSSGSSSNSRFHISRSVQSHETVSYLDDPIKESDFEENTKLWQDATDQSWGAPLYHRDTSNFDKLTMWKRKVTDTVSEYKLRGITPCEVDHYFQFNVDLEYHRLWNSQTLVLEYLADVGNSALIYYLVKYPWPMSHREYYYHRRLKKKNKDEKGQEREYMWICRVADKDFGLQAKEIQEKKYKSNVRIERYESRANFRSLSTAPDKATEWVVTAIDDPQASLPKYLMDWIVETALPSFFDTLKKSCLGYEDYLNKTKSRTEECQRVQKLKPSGSS